MKSVELGFLSDLLGFRIKQANYVLLSGGDKELKKVGISSQQFSVLAMASINPGIIQTRLCKKLNLTRSTCSELVEQLIQKDLLLRTPIDRRSFGLSLTSKGEQALSDAKEIVFAHTAETTQHMSTTEVSDLIRLLAKFSAQQ